MWLNDKEEEEVNYDWSDRNTNMAAKKDNYSVCSNLHEFMFVQNVFSQLLFWIFQGLMRELELREKKINDIQALGDKMVRDGHPGKQTVEVS